MPHWFERKLKLSVLLNIVCFIDLKLVVFSRYYYWLIFKNLNLSHKFYIISINSLLVSVSWFLYYIYQNLISTGILIQITGPKCDADSYCVRLRSKAIKVIFIIIIKEMQKRDFWKSMVKSAIFKLCSQ